MRVDIFVLGVCGPESSENPCDAHAEYIPPSTGL